MFVFISLAAHYDRERDLFFGGGRRKRSGWREWAKARASAAPHTHTHTHKQMVVKGRSGERAKARAMVDKILATNGAESFPVSKP